ncbi:MAG: DUF1295 domain-containing protein [Calditrichaeota bacterium]|nr:MAG: DUF1295 domain-containing protein [Calditrichota bacterium]
MMTLKDQFENSGKFLFTYRSYMPLLFVGFILLAARDISQLKSPILMQMTELLSLFLATTGLAVRIITVGQAAQGTSGRNTRNQVATSLNTTGIYSIGRHPLYLGNFIIFFACLLFLQVVWLLIIGVVCFWLYYERIMFAEEAFLRKKFNYPYLLWATNTPAIFPKLSKWKKSEIKFALKKAIRQEYTTFGAIALTLTLLKAIKDSLVNNSLYLRQGWLFFFGVSVAVYLVVRIIKKKTSILQTTKN